MAKSCLPLITVLQEVPDFRHARGKRYRLDAILALAVAAILCGYESYSAMAEWGQNYGPELVSALGFTRLSTPCAATFHNIFRHLDQGHLQRRLTEWAESVLRSLPVRHEESAAVALDGKVLCGSATQKASVTHLLSAVSHRLGLTLAQEGTDSKTGESQLILGVLESLFLRGRIVTVDALHTRRSVAQLIVEAGGDYIMMVKRNSPCLLDEIRPVFEERHLLADTMTSAETYDAGHGRIEYRQLTASSVLADYTDWPGLQQVFQIQRTIVAKKSQAKRSEVVYGITSLRPEQADARRLLRLVRGHWRIENRTHWVRDVTFDEDRSQVRSGHLPEVMATLRNAAIGLMRCAGESNLAAARRRFAAQPWQALSLLGVRFNN